MSQNEAESNITDRVAATIARTIDRNMQMISKFNSTDRVAATIARTIDRIMQIPFASAKGIHPTIDPFKCRCCMKRRYY